MSRDDDDDFDADSYFNYPADWDAAQVALYESVFEEKWWTNGNEEAVRLFNDTFFEGLKGLEFEYSFDRLEMYIWNEWGIEIDTAEFWEDFREWYDSQ